MEPSSTSKNPRCPFLVADPQRIFDQGRLVLGPWDGFPVSPRHLDLHVIPRYARDVTDPSCGMRWVVPERSNCWTKP